MKRKQPDLLTIGRVLQLEWKLTDAQRDEALQAFFPARGRG